MIINQQSVNVWLWTKPHHAVWAVTALVLGSPSHLKVVLFHWVEKRMGAHGLNVDVSCQDAPTNCSVNAFRRHPYLKNKNKWQYDKYIQSLPWCISIKLHFNCKLQNSKTRCLTRETHNYYFFSISLEEFFSLTILTIRPHFPTACVPTFLRFLITKIFSEWNPMVPNF